MIPLKRLKIRRWSQFSYEEKPRFGKLLSALPRCTWDALAYLIMKNIKPR